MDYDISEYIDLNKCNNYVAESRFKWKFKKNVVKYCILIFKYTFYVL